MSSSALITGGAGFIGSHLADRLIGSGWQVTALDDLSTGARSNVAHLLPNADFQLVQGSVLDRDLTSRLVQDADVVFHLAAAVGVRVILDHPLESLLTNIRGTENVMEAAERRRTKVLLASTSEIYGKNRNGPFGEDDDRLLGPPRTLRWSYSTSKAVDEILAYAYFRDRSVPTIVARLFNTVGPRQTGRYGMVLPRFVAQALRGEDLTVFGDGTQSRVFTYVGDVVEALTRLIESRAAEGETFNVAGGEELSINALAQRVLDRTKSTSRIAHIPYIDAYGEGFEDTQRRAADTTKLELTIGYRCETPLDLVIDRVVAYQRAALSHQEGGELVHGNIA